MKILKSNQILLLDDPKEYIIDLLRYQNNTYDFNYKIYFD